MYPRREDEMPEQTTERNIYIRIAEDLLWRLRIRIRCAELDTTIQDFVVELLEQELSANSTSRRSSASHAARRAAVPGGAARKDKDR